MHLRARGRVLCFSLFMFLGVACLAADSAWIDPRLKPLNVQHARHLVVRPDGELLTVANNQCLISKNGGRTWRVLSSIVDGPEPSQPVDGLLAQLSDGTLVLAYIDRTEVRWKWDNKTNQPLPNSRREVWAIRSTDGGKTWKDRQPLLTGYCGALIDLVVTDDNRVVVPVQRLLYNPGRHGTACYVSRDSGQTWSESNVIDIGGHGHHDGAFEPTITQLSDGRLWMLLRTNEDVFYQSFSSDGGRTWPDAAATTIDASSSPGALKRLASGRLMLVWNRLYATGETSAPRRGSPYSQMPGSWHRSELSLAWSDNDGQSWSPPVAIAKTQASYPHLSEVRPGEIWLSAGKSVKHCLHEADFVLAAGDGTEAHVDTPDASEATAVLHPQFVMPSPANEGTLITMPDGRIKHFYMIMGKQIESIESKDGGLTWSEPTIELPMNGLKSHHACRVLLDRDAELHVWFVVHVDRKQEPNRSARAIDVWHAKTKSGKWGEPKRVFVGYVGALRGAEQMMNGRIVVALSVWNDSEPVPRHGPEGTGNHFITSIYSDDAGESWQVSPALLTSPVFPNYNGNNYGAIEPSIISLADGRLWMLMRTQTGVLYQSHSRDGVKWSPAQPTQFYSSSSPTAVTRLGDGSLVLVWNNAQMPARRGRQMLYAGRDVLHAALSTDEGKTWRGFREVYRDPARNRKPPASGDRGTAYPTVTQAKSGEIIVASGQGERHRGIVRFSPAWLLETTASEDFSQGLENCCAFTEFGKPYSIFLNRKQGPSVVDVASDREGEVRRALHVRRPAADEPADAALWNFPAGKSGTLRFRLRIDAASQGGVIALSDRFFNPGDPQSVDQAMFVLPIDAKMAASESSDSEWRKIELRWNLAKKSCAVIVDGKPAAKLSLQHPSPHGISYVRFQSTADKPDPLGLQIANVAVTVDP